ncbi:MAG: xanthine dehydrogenase family protein subunit M, partial [Chloroflexi bacterium]
MNPFQYERASDALGVVALLPQASTGAFSAGGTNLVDRFKLAERRPDPREEGAGLPYDQIEPLPDGGGRI